MLEKFFKKVFSKNIKSLNHAKTSKDGKTCKACLHFIPETNECKTVAGAINPEGWCSIYFKHPSYKEKIVEDNNESNMTALK